MIYKQAPAQIVPKLVIGAEECAIEGLVSWGGKKESVFSYTDRHCINRSRIVGFTWVWQEPSKTQCVIVI